LKSWTGIVEQIVGYLVGLAARATAEIIMAYEFENHMCTRELEVVKKRK
jgi:hypothetical protein